MARRTVARRRGFGAAGVGGVSGAGGVAGLWRVWAVGLGGWVGQRVGEEGGGAAVGGERGGLAAVFEADDRLGAGRGRGVVRVGRGSPEPGVGVQEGVVAGHPLVGLAGQEVLAGPGGDAGRGQLGDGQLVPQVTPQQRRAVRGDGRVGEPPWAARIEQVPELVWVEQADQAGAGGQDEVAGRPVHLGVRTSVGNAGHVGAVPGAGAGRRDQGVVSQRGPDRVEQGAEHRPGREPGRVQRQCG